MFRVFLTLAAGMLLFMGPAAGTARASLIVYSMDMIGFLVDTGGAPNVLDFDSIAPGTDITNTVIDGIQFNGPGAPLIVVEGAATETTGGFLFAGDINQNRLFPTSGLNVLSPGGTQLAPGPNPALENDSLTLVFLQPLVAFGIDLLWQQADGASFTEVSVYNQGGTLLYNALLSSLALVNGNGWSGGADFFGVIATGGDLIGRVEFREMDTDNRYTDSNIGYDTIFHQTADTATPEPASMALIGAGLLALGLMRRRKVEE